MRTTDITKTGGWERLCEWCDASDARTVHLRLSSYDVTLQLIDCETSPTASAASRGRPPGEFDALVDEMIAGVEAARRRDRIEAEVRAEVERRLLGEASTERDVRAAK